MILPKHVDDKPPVDINVSADGGLTAPANQQLGLPAAGVYFKDRFSNQDTNHDSTDPQENQFEHAYTRGTHRCVLLPIPGEINSSTRSEAHGLLVSTCSKGPVHIGIDNKAVVDRANSLLDLATH